jgi:hypothetical protein
MTCKYLHPVTAHIEFKKLAKQLKLKKSITHTDALDYVAQQYGFSNWYNALKAAKATETLLETSYVLACEPEMCDQWSESQLSNFGFVLTPDLQYVLAEQLFQELKTSPSTTRDSTLQLIRTMKIYVCNEPIKYLDDEFTRLRFFISVSPRYKWLNLQFTDHCSRISDSNDIYVDSWMDFGGGV